MATELILIKKKNGVLEAYNSEKIVKAIRKSAERADGPLTDQEEAKIVNIVENEIYRSSDNVIPVESMHNHVISALKAVRKDVADSYREYHDWRKSELRQLEEDDRECQSIQFGLEKSN